MCGLGIRPAGANSKHPHTRFTNEPAFSSTRLNQTTFVLEENDRWGENPLIYVKLLSSNIIIIDAGCGGKTNTPDIDTTLKIYIETVPVPANDNKPLNPEGVLPYTIICTHCHYDHIGGIPEFIHTPDLAIWASALGKQYIQDPTQFPKSSLCRYVGMPVPQYTITNWATDNQVVTSNDGRDLGLVIYQTPGHCPDELAVWDPSERVLFVGDTTYENAPTLFPNGGNVVRYTESIDKLLRLVKVWNEETVEDRNVKRVEIACGHITRNADAECLLTEVQAIWASVLRSEIRPVDRTAENYAWAGGEPVLEFRPKESKYGIYFQGLKSVFED